VPECALEVRQEEFIVFVASGTPERRKESKELPPRGVMEKRGAGQFDDGIGKKIWLRSSGGVLGDTLCRNADMNQKVGRRLGVVEGNEVSRESRFENGDFVDSRVWAHKNRAIN